MPCAGWQTPYGMLMRYANHKSDHRLSQPGVVKPFVAATLGQTAFQIAGATQNGQKLR